MLFNSYEFLLLFLPVTILAYYLLNRHVPAVYSKLWLALASLFFYSWWNIAYLPLILVSIAVNYLIGTLLIKKSPVVKLPPKAILVIGIVFNVGLLGYYKYTDFMISNINAVFSSQLPFLHIILPLGISFFTFTQIAYLVDAYRSEAGEYDPVNYVLFVTFFPHLLAGPILHHKEMMPQFQSKENLAINWSNMAQGLFLLAIGLVKKVVIADTLATAANYGFDTATALSLVEAWVTSISYTLQLYYDFSGYTDMALGVALMFNIKLPINFNSPYKSLDIQDFWRRWHMTLSRFLGQYIYIPLGGNREGELRTYRNLMLTFLIGGLWHGAGWTFVFWGFLHGAALVVHRFWQKFDIRMNRFLAWFITFNFVNIAWVFFRAKTMGAAVKVLVGMFGLSGIVLPPFLARPLGFLTAYGIYFDALHIEDFQRTLIYIAIFLVAALFMQNSIQLKEKLKTNWAVSVLVALSLTYAILNLNKVTEFIYFNF